MTENEQKKDQSPKWLERLNTEGMQNQMEQINHRHPAGCSPIRSESLEVQEELGLLLCPKHLQFLRQLSIGQMVAKTSHRTLRRAGQYLEKQQKYGRWYGNIGQYPPNWSRCSGSNSVGSIVGTVGASGAPDWPVDVAESEGAGLVPLDCHLGYFLPLEYPICYLMRRCWPQWCLAKMEDMIRMEIRGSGRKGPSQQDLGPFGINEHLLSEWWMGRGGKGAGIMFLALSIRLIGQWNWMNIP